MELTELGLNEEQLSGVNDYLESQLQAKIQSEGDKIRTKYNTEINGYKTKITDYDKTIEELTAKIPVTKTESELKVEQMIKEYDEEKKALAREKMEIQFQKQLKDKGLNEQLQKYVKFEGVEDLETYLTEFADIIGKQANANSYKPSNHTQTTNITKADFSKMNYQERANLYNTNKELYDSLSK